jgi:hypothetical protein
MRCTVADVDRSVTIASICADHLLASVRFGYVVLGAVVEKQCYESLSNNGTYKFDRGLASIYRLGIRAQRARKRTFLL